MSLLKLLEQYVKEEKDKCQCCESASRRLSDSGWRYGADDNWRHWWPVSKQALAKVDAIRDQALALGWTEAQLYQNRSWYHFSFSSDYGLVTYVDLDRVIGAVTPQAIEIIEEPCKFPPGWQSIYYKDVGHRFPKGSPPLNVNRPKPRRPLPQVAPKPKPLRKATLT